MEAPLQELGLEDDQREALRAALTGVRGLVVLVGLRGAGLDAGCAAGARALVAAGRAVAAVARPGAARVADVRQHAPDPVRGVMPADALRAALAEPVEAVIAGVLVDRETATLAFEAAAERLVVAGFYGRSTEPVPGRLVELGLDPERVALTVVGFPEPQET